jgi:UDP-2,3-diacylglucosamine hydrolase
LNRSLFISDLHLAPERPAMIDLFVRFCDEIASHYKTLYILGDFVEYWLGDDDPAEGLQPAFDALRKLADTGCSIFFMHGNRDFLIGDALAQRCGFKHIPDPSLIHLNDKAILLMHGDTLCTDDLDYMQFRNTVRDESFQKSFLAKSLSERQQIAQSLRESSKEATAQKKPEIMDVNQQAVESVISQNNVQLLIHGHTHRPAIHTLEIQGVPCKRIVLGDWYDRGSYLVLDGTSSFELQEYH